MALTKCMECGGLLSDTAKSCPHCGAPIIKCNECGKLLPAESEVCPHCGTRQQIVFEEVKSIVKTSDSNLPQTKVVKRESSLTSKIWLGIFIFLIVFLISTNPSQNKHEHIIKNEINEAVAELRDSMGISSGVAFFGDLLLDEITKTVLGHRFEVDSYWIFSVGKIEFQGKEHIVTIGIANNVFCLFSKENLKHVVLKWQRTKRNDVTNFFGKIKGMFGFGGDSHSEELEDEDEDERHKNLLEELFGGDETDKL